MESTLVRARVAVIAVLALALLVAACGGTTTTSPPLDTGSPATGEPATPAPDDTTAPSSEPTEPGATEAPTDEPTEDPTEEPTEEPTESPDGSASPGTGAAACSGTDDNRAFFEQVAEAVAWDVYCAVLPSGWFLESGQWRGASGGRMTIAYKGPGGARFTLSEGAFCADASGCVPPGTESGSTAFGGFEGTLYATEEAGWALVVDEGAPISWLAVGTGVDEAEFVDLAAALALVEL